MKRNWELIRSVLEEVEALGAQEFHRAQYSYDEDTPDDETQKVRHVVLLRDAGFIAAIDIGAIGSSGVMSPELTWQGHELLDTIRSKTVWTKVKTMAKDKGIELTFDAVKALGKVALDQVLNNGA